MEDPSVTSRKPRAFRTLPSGGAARAGRRRGGAARCVAALALWWGGLDAVGAATRVPLAVYTAIEADQQVAFKAAIEAAVPDVEVVWTYGHTGELTDRLAAEKSRPRADVVLGLAATSLALLKAQGLLQPYRPRGAEDLRSRFTDRGSPYSWTGMDAYLGVVCVNTDAASENRVSLPATWHDLLDPRLKGRITAPDPVRSGTGYLLVAGWLQGMGETAGWRFMDALDRNVSAYLPSGSAPCTEAAAGRSAVGLSYDGAAARLKAGGAPVGLVVPIDGVGWELEAAAIVRGTAHEPQAEAIMDWAASRAANALYASTYAIVAHPAVSSPPADYPPYAEARMIRNDLTWAANNRARILAEWTRRYGSKARAP